MKKQSVRIFVLVVAFIIVGLAISATFPGPRIRTARFSHNTLGQANIFDRQGDFLRSTRGILMQSFADFRGLDSSEISVRNVSVQRNISGNSYEYCLKISTDPCASFLLTNSQLEGLALFVKNNRYRAFTLPGNVNSSFDMDANSVIETIQQSMKPIDDDYRRDDWIANELDPADFASIFRYVDYDDPYSFSNYTFEYELTWDLVEDLNSDLGHSSRPDSSRIDSTWINTDLHANFQAYAFNGNVVCDGLPARYEWSLYSGEQYAYVDSIKFAAPETYSSAHEDLFIEAQSIFCTTAILRALYRQDKTSLAHFF